MERRDYLLREIEKIGIVLQAILNRLTGKGGNSAITLESSFEATREMLFNETDFDLTGFLAMGKPASAEYLLRFKGMNTTNLGELAEILYLMGINEQADRKRIFLDKAILIYELCESMDKTYSIERERKIKEIQNII